VQLGGLEAGRVHDLDDTPGSVVTEDPNSQKVFSGQPFDDVGYSLWGDLARRRGENKTDGVGPHGHGQEGVVLRGGTADLQ
jgi:hypothetical protein